MPAKPTRCISVYSNTAGAEGGGSAAVSNDALSLTANRTWGNVAGGEGGGGIYLVNSHDGMLVNNVVVDNRNRDRAPGAGLYLDYTRNLRLIHTTLASNRGGDSSALFVTDSIGASGPPASSVALTNTILVSHTVGISVTAGNRVAVNGILWYNTPITVTAEATATVTAINQHTGDPAFAADGYHLTTRSPAIDAGLPAGVTADIDDEARPQGAGYDLGADEYPAQATPTPTPTATATRIPGATPTATATRTVSPPARRLYLPLILRASGKEAL